MTSCESVRCETAFIQLREHVSIFRCVWTRLRRAPSDKHWTQKSGDCPQTDSIGGLTREPERFQTDQGDSTPGALPVTHIDGQSTLIKQQSLPYYTTAPNIKNKEFVFTILFTRIVWWPLLSKGCFSGVKAPRLLQCKWKTPHILWLEWGLILPPLHRFWPVQWRNKNPIDFY